MDFLNVNCPYCNTKITLDWKENQTNTDCYESTSCCNRMIFVRRDMEPVIRVGATSKSALERAGLNGDVSKFPGMPILDDMRPNSRWTKVMTDGMMWYVRICPNDVDTESLGRPWGLSFTNKYTSRYEAHNHADSIDQFLDGIFEQKLEGMGVVFDKNDKS